MFIALVIGGILAFAIIAVIIASLDKEEDRFVVIFFVLWIILFVGMLLGQGDYRSLTSLETGNTYKVLSVTNCSKYSLCFVLENDQEEDGKTEKYYKTEKTNIDETVEVGDIVIYTNDYKLKVIDKENFNSDSKTEKTLLEENITPNVCE